MIRRLLSDALVADPAIEIAGIAANGKIALLKIPQINPDIITLDIEMPEMDGLTTLKEIRKLYPKLPVIMFSTLSQRGAEATLDALANGANDYVAKPANVGSVTAAIQNVQNELLPKITQFCTWTTRSNFGCLGNARCGIKCWTCSPDCSTPTNRGRNHATDFVGQDRPNARKGRNLK